ncbi:MAG: chemotaxis protein CheW [Deltaproteobacteria bacterium]|nr:chemotaxis protein CheW [Deltaproteobacteria bacterium]
MAATKQFCTFYLDNLYFGIDVDSVQEVLRYEEMTPVPLACREISGLINLRGLIVPAIDLRKRLGYSDLPEGEHPMNVVCKINNEPVSLLVDRIGDVIDVEEDLFEDAPETVVGRAREVIVGIYKLPETLLLYLDQEKVLEDL